MRNRNGNEETGWGKRGGIRFCIRVAGEQCYHLSEMSLTVSAAGNTLSVHLENTPDLPRNYPIFRQHTPFYMVKLDIYGVKC